MSKQILRIIPQPLRTNALTGKVRREARIEGWGEGENLVWFEWDAVDAPRVWPEHAHSFLLVMLFPAMSKGLDIRVEGAICPTLLENLEWFMDVWSHWKSRCYQRVKIEAQSHPSADAPPERKTAIQLFSGGLDSCSALHLNAHRSPDDLRKREIKRTLLVNGADFGADDQRSSDVAFEFGSKITGDLGIPLHRITSNFQAFGSDFPDSHGCAFASCVHWYDREVSTGIIASSGALSLIAMPWGSHPLTDRFLSSRDFEIVYDTLVQRRIEKTEAILTWPVARDNIRVCFRPKPGELNCGKCRKCRFTLLGFLACGTSSGAFPADIKFRDVFGLWDMPSWSPVEIIPILEHADRRGLRYNPTFLLLRLVLLFNQTICNYLRRIKLFIDRKMAE